MIVFCSILLVLGLRLVRVVGLLRRREGSLRLRRLVTLRRGLITRLRRSLVLLLLLLLGRGRGRHVHALLLSLVALGDGTLREASLDFVVLLDEGTAETPVADAAIAHAAALNTESLTDLTTLHHGVAAQSSSVTDMTNNVDKAYIQPQPVTQLMAQKMRASLLQVSAVCMVGSLMRSAVLPKTVDEFVSFQLIPRQGRESTYECMGKRYRAGKSRRASSCTGCSAIPGSGHWVPESTAEPL